MNLTVSQDIKIDELPREKHCVTCNAAERPEVEKGLILGYTYRSIAESLPRTSSIWLDKKGEEVPLHMAVRRVAEHSRRHSVRTHVVQRSLMEAWAEAEGIDVEGGKGTIVTEMGLLTDVMRIGFERIASGEITPTLKEALQATSILLRHRQRSAEVGGDVFVKAIEAMFSLVEDRFGADATQWLYSEMEQSPAVQGAIEAFAAEQSSGE